MSGCTRPLHEPVPSETARLRAELRLELAQLETRMTMWMAIYAMAAIAVGIVWTMAAASFRCRRGIWIMRHAERTITVGTDSSG